MQPKLIRFLLPLCLSVAAVRAEVQTSEIQGFVKASAPANTDTLVSPVFSRPVAWYGAVQSVSGNHVTVAGTTGWTTNQYAPGTDTYYVRVRSGTLNGQIFTVVSNDATSVLLDNAGFNLGQLAASDQLELVPYWTLGTLYPASQAGVSFIASTSSLVRQTELYFYDPNGVGYNRTASFTYYFYNGAWRKFGANVTVSYNNIVVPPDTYFVHRNKAAATTLTLVGRVHPGSLGTVLESQLSTKQDNYVAVGYPVDLTLRQTALGGSGGFATSSSDVTHADELLVYDPTQTGINRTPSATYYYYNGGWRKSGASSATDFSDSVTLTAGGGFIVRKAAGGMSGVWTFNSNL